jgi:integrase
MAKSSTTRVAGQFFAWKLFRRDGVWYADGRQNAPNVGKHSLGTRDRETALRALNELDRRKAVEQGLARQAAGDGHAEVAIDEGWKMYLEEHAAAPDVLGGTGASTQARYRAVRDKHLKFCAASRTRTWNAVDKASVKAYGKWLRDQDYGDGTIYLELTLLKQVIGWLITEKAALPESCRVRLPLRRSEDSHTYCYTRVQVRAMLGVCRADPALHWLADVIVALATTGMRIGELADLRWTDVDLTAAVITLSDNRHSGKARSAGAVRTTKGRRTRRIDVHPQLRALLENLPHRADGRVFGGECGGRLDPDKVLKRLKRDVIAPLKSRFPTPQGEVGFEHGVVHSFRHFFVTEAFVGGASEGEVMGWVGHRDSRIVRRYRHMRDTVSRQRMAELKFFGSDDDLPPTEAPASAGDPRASDDHSAPRAA